ncbi:MAG: EAL domain-containing protein [Acetatifactor sp.]
MRRRQVLIVEDNELNLAMLEEILQGEYEILKAVDGLDGLAVLQQNKESIALILLDIMMPVMNGYDFLDAVRSDSEFANIPIIVMTQADSEEDEIGALEHGATDFIPKPYRAKVIRHRVASLIKLRETAAMVNQFKYDRLTGLYTKDFFYRKVREVLDANPEKEYSILCCNLENFKLYNDTFGRQAGDKLLIEVARILKKRVSPDAICCRFTADRFLCLTDRESELKGRKCFVKAREKTRSELAENISVKLSIYEIWDPSIPVEKMCDRALWVVNTIKGIYDKHLVVYDETLRKQLLREQIITDAMEEALEQKQFAVFFQPKYNLHDGRMVGAEALVRWIHPEWGFLSPGEFIPLFEKNGFICKLDEYVWDRTCERLRDWMDKGYGVVPVSVNVSRADIYHAHLVEHLCELVDKYRIDPSYLHLEITESAYTENPEQIISTVEDLRRRGFVIEMDDFGSGYSSLNMLGQISIDILKLDMGFIRTEFEKPLEQSILNDVVNMAHRLHLNVIAEGVETGSQRNQLRELGCDYAQGFYYAKPMPDKDYEEMLQKAGVNRERGRVSASRTRIADEHKKCVLVIEDNEINRELLTEILAEQYLVLTAENGKDGLDKLNRYGQAVCVILLDIKMPVMNGYEFLEQVKKHPLFSRIPVIVTTVLSSVEEEEKCMQMGAADFIEKPYHSGRILKRIGNLIHMREYDVAVSGLETDELTGFKNRKAYFEDIAMIEHDPEKKLQPMGILFADINGLKMLNDREGHEAGDRMIVEIAQSMRKIFTDADIYRVGGDEFVIFSFEKNREDFDRKRKALEASWKDGPSASLGSVWLERAAQLERNVELADQDMYRSKRQYYLEETHDRRKKKEYLPGEILQKMDEISEYLPGGFFIYRAGEGEELISFNRELLRLYGFVDGEEFRTFTGNSFRGMVHPDDLERAEKMISSQIEKENDIDSVEYRILCKDGSVRRVRDYGRFVHSEAYGDVFYVFLNDITGSSAGE